MERLSTAKIEPLFPFGHGLSYTTFEYSNPQVNLLPEGPDNRIQISVDVRNSGRRSGREVVQLYLHDNESSLKRPPQELKGFQKVSLRPGEMKTIRFTLDKMAFSFYDPERKEWTAELGDFEVRIGSSSRDIRARKTFFLYV
jgi:beta-glucosidase